MAARELMKQALRCARCTRVVTQAFGRRRDSLTMQFLVTRGSLEG